jgi:endonuclease YncB( thermonuclease family)
MRRLWFAVLAGPVLALAACGNPPAGLGPSATGTTEGGSSAAGQPAASRPAAAGAPDVTATVLRVSDGDTVVVTLADGSEMKVRLLGIDAPETSSGDCGADAATAGLMALAPPGSAVTFSRDAYADAEDRYGRWLRYMATGDVPDVALELIARGLVEAWIPASEPEPERWDAYTAAMDRARDARVGSWAGCDSLGR